MLFSTTIAENICYGAIDTTAVSDDQVWQAARMANAEVFISQFPNQLNTLVGERGVMLSGGYLECCQHFSFTARRFASAVLATAIPSVCLSVRPSHAGIVLKRRHVARCSLHYRIAKCV